MIQRQHAGRSGAIIVEGAIVYPVMFLLLFGIIVAGMGVVHYQQVACQAREAARYAAVKGSSWAAATSKTSPTSADIKTNTVVPMATAMDQTKLTVQVQWIDGVSGNIVDWDSSSKSPTTQTASGNVANKVRVTVTYQWFPEFGVAGPITLKSVAEMAMEF
jgi:Flp pilus assembly protein TadG